MRHIPAERARISGLVVGTAIMALVVAGCSGANTTGGSSNGGGAKTITFFTSLNALYPTQQQQWFKDVSAAFQKETGSKVAFETYSTGNQEQLKIETSAVSNQGPDIYDIGTTFTPTADSTGAFVKLSAANWTAIGGKTKFLPSTLGMSGPDASNQIAVPWTSEPYVLAYNTELLAKAGISKPATTWDGLASQAKKLTTGNGVYGIATGYNDPYLPWKFIWAMDRQAGTQLVNGKTANLNNAATLKSYRTYFGWLTQDHVVNPDAVGWDDAQALAAFAGGKAAFYPMTTSIAIKTLDNSKVKGEYKFALMPTVPPGATSTPVGGTPVASILSGENLVVAQYSQNQALDFKLIKFLTDPAQQKLQFDVFGKIPVNQTAANALEGSDPALAPIVAAAAGSYATPFTGAWGDVELALSNVVVQSIPGLAKGTVSDSSVQSLLGAAQKSSQSALNSAK